MLLARKHYLFCNDKHSDIRVPDLLWDWAYSFHLFSVLLEASREKKTQVTVQNEIQAFSRGRLDMSWRTMRV